MAAGSLSAAETTLRLRIAWGGGTARQWTGSVRLSEGMLSELSPLGIEADEPGSIWLDDGAVQVEQRTARADDGFDVLATAQLDARLVLNLSADPGGQSPAKPVEIPLKDLLIESVGGSLDQQKNRLLVMRTPGDRLRVAVRRDSLVFAPGEALQIEIEPHLLDVAAGSMVRIKAQLTGPAAAKAWSHEYDMKLPEAGPMAEPLQIETPLPPSEGVYDLTLSALGSRAPWAKPLAERKVQLVVVADKPPPAGSAPTVKLLELDPANPRWWDRLANLPLVPGVRKGPLGSGNASRWEHTSLGPLTQLAAPGAETDGSWEAYPLPIDRPGQVHLLEIEYPSDVPQTLGMSLVEPNAAGAVMPIGLDSGVYVGENEAERPAKLLRHRVPFWPRTRSPLLLMTNRRRGGPAVYGKIRVWGPPSSQFGGLSLSRQEPTPSNLPRTFATSGGQPERLLAGYLDRPLLAANFSAVESLDSFSRRSLDDWTTFHQAGTRLVEYLHYVGYNGLMLTVYEGGSAIFPSELIEATPQHDTGVYFSTGQDPLRKDVLELVLRLFDREQLQLIPTLSFTTPLPALEALRRQGGRQSVGIQWIGPDGRPGGSRRQPSAPQYNPLNAQVQEAVLAVVHEMVERYRDHASLAGVALRLSADSFVQLPADEGSFDDDTIARFERDTKVALPGSGPNRFAERAKFLSVSASQAWLNWRAARLAEFHLRIYREIATLRTDARLYLAGATMLDSPQSLRSLRPALPPRANVKDVLLRLGIRPEAYAATDGVVLLRPQRLAPIDSLAARGLDLEVNGAPEVDRLFACSKAGGSLLFHEPQRGRLASFDSKSPFGPANTYLSLTAQYSPSAAHNRQRFAHSLATLDSQAVFDGGWLLPLGQEESLRDWVSAYRQLPAERFAALPWETQPVVIRTLTRGGQTFVYLVNDSPWPAEVQLQVQMPPGCRMERLGTSRGMGPISASSRGANWKISLQAYDLCAARFSAPAVRLQSPQIKLPDDVQAGLQRRISNLAARAAALGNRNPLGLLQNPDLELAAGAEGIPGWEAAAPPGTAVDLDAQQPHGGMQSIRLRSNGQSVAVRSNAFPAPRSGRLSVELWLRVDDPRRQPTVRMAVEGQSEEGGFYRCAIVGAATGVQLTDRWDPYTFQVDDLPAEGLTDLRVSFELTGAGAAWIDDVQLLDLAFSGDERLELANIIGLASYKLQSRKFGDCARLLDGYWPKFLEANVPLQVARAPRPAPAKQPGNFDPMKIRKPKFLD